MKTIIFCFMLFAITAKGAELSYYKIFKSEDTRILKTEKVEHTYEDESKVTTITVFYVRKETLIIACGAYRLDNDVEQYFLGTITYTIFEDVSGQTEDASQTETEYIIDDFANNCSKWI